MIEFGDRLLVAVSGGKDSWTLLHILMHFQRVSPVRFELIPVTIHPGYESFNVDFIENGYRRIAPHLQWKIVKTEINKTIEDKNTPGKHPCAFCARLRRGALYRIASDFGCKRIALGHHADDAIETLLLSGFFEGNLVSLPPVLNSDDYPVQVIRPLIRVWEGEIRRYSSERHFPEVSCGHEESSGGKRAYIKDLLSGIEKSNPIAKSNLLASLHKINPRHFLDNKWL